MSEAKVNSGKRHIRITEKPNGRWRIDLDEAAMAALVSMVRLELGSGWASSELCDDPDEINAGRRLEAAIDKAW